MRLWLQLVGLIALVSVLQVPASVSPAAAANPVGQADPSVGPNAMDEARHAHDILHLAPATAAIQPRRSTMPAGPIARGYASQGPAINPANGVSREVLGFAPYWELANYANWNYSLLTTVAYFGLDVNGDGSISATTSGWTGWNSQNLVNTINAAHAAGDRAVVVIKAFDEATINQIVTMPGATQTAITNTINAIAAKNLDGVNVDFEGSASSSYPNLQSGFTTFIRSLSSQVHQRWPQAMVSVDTYSGSASWDGGIFKIGDLAPNVDALFVMAYDMAFGNMLGYAGPNAPLNGWTYNDSTAVSQYLSKAPAIKILLGVPYYGYKWSTVGNGPYAMMSGGVQADTYAGVLTDLSCGAQQLSQSWDSLAASPWASWYSPQSSDPCGGNHGSWRELYYDNAASLGDKYDLINNSNLLGTGMWALGYDGSSQDLWNELKIKFGNPWPGQYHAVSPARIFDTRAGSHPLRPGETRSLTIAGQPGVPVPADGAVAVTFNVTVTNPTTSGFLTIFPSGTAPPATSNLNFEPGMTVANLVDVTLGRAAAISMFNASGTTDVVLDVVGWTSVSGGATDTGGLFRSVPPARLLDTRSSASGPVSLGPQQSIALPVLNRGNIPASGVSAVALNVTATNATAGSFLSVFPTGGSPPGTSSVNVAAGQTVANRVIVPIGSSGQISIYNGAGTVDVVVDANGWFTDGSDGTATGGRFTGLPLARIIDTRFGTGGVPRAPLRPGSPLTVRVAGVGGVPSMSSVVPPRAVLINVTVTDATAASYLTVFPSDVSQPATSDLNWATGGTVANLTLVGLGADGGLTLVNGAGTADVVIDVVGWFN